MKFAFPANQLPIWVLAAVVSLVVLALLLSRLEKHRRGRLQRFVDADLAPRLLGGYEPAIRRPLNLLTLLGFAFLIAAFFQPHWGAAWEEVRQVSRDVLVVLDTSESMNATNPLPTRIERAKQEVAGLLDRARGDRFGLIAFSGAAALQCPLTLDHGYFKAVLNAVDTNTISREGTDIAAALDEAIQVFEKEEATVDDYNRDARAVLLISDGEAVSGNAVKASEELSKYARVFVIGVGDPDGTRVELPQWMGRGRPSGRNTHVSRLDEDTLMRIATAGNGAYTRSQADTWDIDQIYDRFKALSTRDVGSEMRVRMMNRYQWPLAGAILCFAAEGLWLVLMPYVRAWRGRKKTSAGGLLTSGHAGSEERRQWL